MPCAGFFIFNHDASLVLFVQNHSGYLSAPKGGIEIFDKSIFECAVRELKEETGFQIHELDIAKEMFIENTNRGKPNITYYVGKVQNIRQNFTFDPSELLSVEWFNVKDFLSNPKLTKQLKQERLRILKEIIEQWNMLTWKKSDTLSDDHKEMIPKKKSDTSDKEMIPKKKFGYDSESRLLVKLLRHHLDLFNHDSEGYVSINDLITFQGKTQEQQKWTKILQNLNEVKILQIIDYDKQQSKQRLDLKNNKLRCNQGHSGNNEIKESDIFTPILSGESVMFVHGTETTFLPLILENGLSRMKRQHIHGVDYKKTLYQTSTNMQNISGFKSTTNAFVIVDVQKAISEGLLFYRSLNHVLLTSGDCSGFIRPHLLQVKTREQLDEMCK